MDKALYIIIWGLKSIKMKPHRPKKELVNKMRGTVKWCTRMLNKILGPEI